MKYTVRFETSFDLDAVDEVEAEAKAMGKWDDSAPLAEEMNVEVEPAE